MPIPHPLAATGPAEHHEDAGPVLWIVEAKLLHGGEPGSGKSYLLNLLVAHDALLADDTARPAADTRGQ